MKKARDNLMSLKEEAQLAIGVFLAIAVAVVGIFLAFGMTS